MVLPQLRIEHHEQLLGTLLRRRVSEPGVQVDVPMKIEHGGGPNPECRSAIRHSVRRFAYLGHNSGSQWA